MKFNGETTIAAVLGAVGAGIIALLLFTGETIKEHRVESTSTDKAMMLDMIQRDTQIQEAIHKQDTLNAQTHANHDKRIELIEVR